jgi:GNAT superfamily N-acetyltransferase
LKPVDEQEVWAVPCLFVARKFRRQGIAVELLIAAVEHVRKQGGKIVEGYPIMAEEKMPAASIYTGTVSAFRQAGFREVARHTPARPIFRFIIE